MHPEIARAMAEAQLQALIEQTATIVDLPWFHDVDARKNKAGLPDLIIPAPPTLCIWELKTMRGRLRAEQQRWGEYLAACTQIDYRVIRPVDMEYVEATLRRGRR